MVSNANTEVEKLISFGQMALEQGWHSKAREYFQQALDLDSSNREAMKGLARANEILSRSTPTPVEPKRPEPVKPLRKVSLGPIEPEVEPAKPTLTDQLAAMLKGKGRWLTLAVIVLLLIVVFAYQRVVSVKPVAQPTLADTYFGQRSMYILRQYFDAFETCDVAKMQNLHWEWASLEPPAPFRAAHQCVIPCMEHGIRGCYKMRSFKEIFGAADEFEKYADCLDRCGALLESLK